MKSSLLLIPLLFFMTSYTIDWSNKDNTIIQTNARSFDKEIVNCVKGDNKCELKKTCLSKDDHSSIDPEEDSGSQYFSTIVKMGNELYYFENTDGFPEWGSMDKSNHKKGSIYVFKKMNCKTYEEQELVSNNEMLKVLESLPPGKNYQYRPYIFGWDVYKDVDFSYFGGVLRFKYVSGSEEGGPWSEYNITMNTQAINNANNAEGYVHSTAVSIDGFSKIQDINSSEIKFSTGFYIDR